MVSRRPHVEMRCFLTLHQALEATQPDYVVIATETAAHIDSLLNLVEAQYDGRVLIEKPLDVFHRKLPENRFRLAAVAYNLRFHPLLAALKNALRGQNVISAQIYCGQYLPDWRPGTDYRHSYSSQTALGGGVLRDLSHELDYLLWLFGACERVAAIGGKNGPLDIRSDDSWGMLMSLANCPIATVQINYLDRPGRREIVVNTAEHTYAADLSQGKLVTDGVPTNIACERDETYRLQHRAMLSDDAQPSLCTLEQGEAVMKLISAVEQAAATGQWVLC
ncbi:Predicted dehydrogenase [Magnetospirillum fulvum]|uniref:Predicted dehydrogenase n=2 Tax=Magnetospirillum fulvum TaxID=1082 RepID=A0A1H6IW43_MAGFU|nr:Predicted dehydrogenase [Magnetospirillum fulvum]